ncbi:hypothetical protein Poly59_12980 [Rubripirellula reticaptiva]|uniref:Uncharacterized protein n=1 Tax=Rubripirellula reticaptiva TaxID=2528013 RepID=A0A5C6FCM5_9BACT|nr:hypothetical protein Poly59_12980 [Rubripirellula reticaptiva]
MFIALGTNTDWLGPFCTSNDSHSADHVHVSKKMTLCDKRSRIRQFGKVLYDALDLKLGSLFLGNAIAPIMVP